MAELNLDDLAVFIRVVERGGFAIAARELRVPTSTVSRAIGRLESTAGVRLLHRTTRNVRPTSEGRDLFTKISSPMSALRGAVHDLEPATRKPKGRLRVTAPNDLCATFLAPVLVAFMERYPLVQLDFALTNEHTNLVDGGFDVALRATARLRDSSLVVRKLGEMEWRVYASPKYLKEHGTPSTPEDLRKHRCILFRATDLVRRWSLLHGNRVASEIELRGQASGDDPSFVRAMVLAGAGIGILPQVNSAAYEATGALVRILPDLHARGATLYIVYPSKENVPARVTAFRDFVIEAFDRSSTPR